ncbi:RNA polymerase factor sigma-70 RpoD [Gottschalkia acidurici 9a]|uniref:RNA polymerase factor sigma-70 RpoD n=1 Tax=Gottschalkia acidurici (strain ATCC 7906 / DSM 604 / BCRC 14475 / CIP 104303 / KCTC 5404 / NCIMB 10678 / 9a) TaxID=1128398 RepID=K0B2U4_GOTA9|nr:RNA polymerase sigma factor [Gottschalkia acidurici]AFS79804.1 RNA polymerase factor sigma-70 RpoD [Gottschalkia acidurici 9a]
MDITDLSDLVNIHGKVIYGFCYKLVKNKVDADDLYQETFLKATELCYKIDKDNNSKGFLISIAIGIWKNNRRKYARRQRIVPIVKINENVNTDYLFKDESTPEDAVISNELDLTIQAAVDKLDDKFRIPLYMYYTAEMSNQDIALALKIPLGTVKSRLHNAKKALKKTLELEVNDNEKF